jgi:aryl-alcohol dehydrogenase-like predicted oxidoreductase
MPLDHFVTLGRSGLRVSPFCLGGMTFGEERGWVPAAIASDAIRLYRPLLDELVGSVHADR